MSEHLDMALDDVISSRKVTNKSSGGGGRGGGGGGGGRSRDRVRVANGGRGGYDGRAPSGYRAASARKPYDRPSSSSSSELTRRLFVGHLPYSSSWQDLKDHFKQCGNVVFADVLKRGSRSSGCGIVEYETRAEAERALRELNETVLAGTDMRIFVREDTRDKFGVTSDGVGNYGRGQGHQQGRGPGRQQARSAPSPTFAAASSSPAPAKCQVYVSNLAYSTTWGSLKDHFKQFGHVLRADVLEGPDGRSKGSGTVAFASEAGANAAVARGTETMLDGRIIHVKLDKFA